MEFISKEAFRQLAEVENTPAVSIFIPLERDGDKQDQNRIRLKNYLKQAERTLQEASRLAPEEVADLLQPAARLIEDGRFAAELEDGLALFLSTEQSHIYSLPVRFAEEGVIGSHFYLRPLMPLMMENGRFYILALSQNEIRLLQATPHSVHELILPDEVPQTLAEALKWEDPESQLQWHTGTSASVSQNRRAVFHGHGVTEAQSQKEGIAEYFRQVADGIDELLKEQSAPLVLVGVEYLLPLYRQATAYPHVLEESLHGNPEQFSAQTLRDQAWELVAPLFAQEKDAAISRIAAQRQSELVTEDLEQIIAAAHYGQIELLLLDEEIQVWGTFDATTGDVQQYQPGDKDEVDSAELVDRTAVYTYLYGGTVYLLPRAEIPGEMPAAALLRVPVSTFA